MGVTKRFEKANRLAIDSFYLGHLRQESFGRRDSLSFVSLATDGPKRGRLKKDSRKDAKKTKMGRFVLRDRVIVLPLRDKIHSPTFRAFLKTFSLSLWTEFNPKQREFEAINENRSLAETKLL